MVEERKLAEPVTRLPQSRTTHIPPLVRIDLDIHTLRQHSHRTIGRPCRNIWHCFHKQPNSVW